MSPINKEKQNIIIGHVQKLIWDTKMGGTTQPSGVFQSQQKDPQIFTSDLQYDIKGSSDVPFFSKIPLRNPKSSTRQADSTHKGIHHDPFHHLATRETA